MADPAVTMGTIDAVSMRRQVGHERLVAADAVVLDDCQAAGPDADRLVKVLERETLAVAQAVFDLRGILADQIVGYVAVVAGRHGVMRALAPGVVLVAHDVAVHARRRIVREIARPLGIIERERRHAEYNAGASSREESEG